MKATNQFLTALLMLFLLVMPMTISAQDEEPKRPEFYSVTKSYWSSNYEGTPAEWRATEKEYRDKVTSKNEYIMWSMYFMHLFTENSNEVLYVQTYPNWEAIGKAAARNAELEKEAWPDEEARNAFLDKLNSAYSIYHSDEIYATLPGAKPMDAEITEDMVLYWRLNKMAFPEDGTWDEWTTLNKKVTEDVIHKNEYVKGYYPSMHAWGSDRRDFNQVIWLDSMSAVENMFDRYEELMKEALTEEEGKAYGKYFKSHGDYLYAPLKF